MKLVKEYVAYLLIKILRVFTQGFIASNTLQEL